MWKDWEIVLVKRCDVNWRRNVRERFVISLCIFSICIQDGSVSAPFTGTAYMVKYFKLIPKKIIKIPQQFRRRFFIFISRCLSIPVFRVTHLCIDTNNVNAYYYKNTTKSKSTLKFAANTYDSISFVCVRRSWQMAFYITTIILLFILVEKNTFTFLGKN